MAKINRTEYLQSIIDEYIDTELHYEYRIQYFYGDGWYAIPDEQRYFGDREEYLGKNWKIAEEEISYLF